MLCTADCSYAHKLAIPLTFKTNSYFIDTSFPIAYVASMDYICNCNYTYIKITCSHNRHQFSAGRATQFNPHMYVCTMFYYFYVRSYVYVLHT